MSCVSTPARTDSDSALSTTASCRTADTSLDGQLDPGYALDVSADELALVSSTDVAVDDEDEDDDERVRSCRVFELRLLLETLYASDERLRARHVRLEIA